MTDTGRTRDEHPRSPCYADPRFTSHRPADIAPALAICARCTDHACQPVLAELLADVTSRRTLEGVWDGNYYSQNTTGRTA